ncbi:hypothetical protein [Ideonella sp.]|uniref:hypothetical protein n=1 Tax=Ideonella sp. TaxID=1929293 RepID=UPI003BB5A627
MNQHRQIETGARIRRDSPKQTKTIDRNGSGLKTRDEAREAFSAHGVSIADWSRKHQVSPVLVSSILSGKRTRPCVRGQSHKIAVLLGIKAGTVGEAL